MKKKRISRFAGLVSSAIGWSVLICAIYVNVLYYNVRREDEPFKE